MKNLLQGQVTTAYFSMEIGFHDSIPSYSGGLGILAGDTLYGAADLGVNVVGVTLLYKHGYFKQVINPEGRQIEEQEQWDHTKYLEKCGAHAVVEIQGRQVFIQVWKYEIKGEGGHTLPIYFLDTDIDGNDEMDRAVCSNLYPTDTTIRLHQSIVLGIGGVKILRNLGYHTFDNYHLNETHPWPAILELSNMFKSDEELRNRLVFTTHTPLKGGHEHYSKETLAASIQPHYLECIPSSLYKGGELNCALLCLEKSKYANGVAEKHQEVSERMYPHYKIDAVTNGIHTNTWVNPDLATLFDTYTPLWRESAFNLRQAQSIPLEKISSAHWKAKQHLINFVNEYIPGVEKDFDPHMFTIGFARRAATYKRHNLIFSDLDRLVDIAQRHGGIQFVFAGKAYPNDEGGKKVIQEIVHLNHACSGNLKVVFLPNYSISLSKKILSGVDIWLNNPQPPLEASGTSGMKAALNGIPNFSVLDGWWLEGCVEGITGWAIGNGEEGEKHTATELEILYKKLDEVILPMYYTNQPAWQEIQRNAIALNASYFNTHRMIMEYLTEAYTQIIKK